MTYYEKSFREKSITYMKEGSKRTEERVETQKFWVNS